MVLHIQLLENCCMYFSNIPLPPDHLGSILLSEVFYYMYNFLSVKHNSMNSIL